MDATLEDAAQQLQALEQEQSLLRFKLTTPEVQRNGQQRQEMRLRVEDLDYDIKLARAALLEQQIAYERRAATATETEHKESIPRMAEAEQRKIDALAAFDAAAEAYSRAVAETLGLSNKKQAHQGRAYDLQLQLDALRRSLNSVGGK